MSFVQDYGMAKHGVLGLTRNLTANLGATKIRANCIAPLWTATNLVPAAMMKETMGIESQTPEAVGKSVALLMVDTERKGQCIFSKRGKYKEVDGGLMAAIFAMTEPDAKDMPMDPEQAKAFEKMFQDAIQNQTYAGSN
jgi:NAD(P)-dependent dehydrogenase (short-subunit alcohol dehydrogenase family)